jgi:hypothetical protein
VHAKVIYDAKARSRAGFDAHLTKPASEAALTEILACRLPSVS